MDGRPRHSRVVHRKTRQAAQSGSRAPARRPGQRKPGSTARELTQGDPPLEPGQRRTEAEVNALTERQMPPRLTLRIENLRVRAHRVSPVVSTDEHDRLPFRG